jgi:hypothetical protein
MSQRKRKAPSASQQQSQRSEPQTQEEIAHDSKKLLRSDYRQAQADAKRDRVAILNTESGKPHSPVARGCCPLP